MNHYIPLCVTFLIAIFTLGCAVPLVWSAEQITDQPEGKAFTSLDEADRAAITQIDTLRKLDDLNAQLTAADALPGLIEAQRPRYAAMMRQTLTQIEQMPSEKAKADQLAQLLRDARAHLNYRPVLEAPLAKGFPPPGPVGEIVIKPYPVYRMARVDENNPRGNRAFNTLFNHIKSNDIKMTAPVEMSYAAPEDADKQPQMASMAFLYETPEQATRTRDEVVEVVDIQPTLVASYAIRGSYDPKTYDAALKTLRTWLADQKDLEVSGEPRYFAYNSPFVRDSIKYAEVQIPIKRIDPKPQAE